MTDKVVPKQPVNTRALLVKVDRYPRAKQIEDCHAKVAELELPKLHSIYEHNEIAEFIRHLKQDEIALVSRLEGIRGEKGRGVGTRFLMNINEICATSLCILDVDSGIRSDSGKAWAELIERVHAKVTRSRGTLSNEQARAMNKIKNKEPGLVEAWLREKELKTDRYIQHARIWGNPTTKPARKAIDQFPDPELRDVSKATIQRIFGSRSECSEWLNKLT